MIPLILSLAAWGAAASVLIGAHRHRRRRSTFPAPASASPLRMILAAYILAIPVEDMLRVPAVGPINGLTDYLGLAVIGACGYRWLTRVECRAPVHAALPLWVGLPGLAALGHGWSVEAPATFVGVISLFALVAVPVSLSSIRVDRADIDRLLGWAAASAALPGALGVTQALTGRLAGPAASADRFALVATDFNHTASALLLPLAAAGTLALGRRPRILSPRNWAGLAALLALAGVSATASRGGLVGVAVAGIILVMTRVAPERRLALTAAGLVVMLALAVPALGRVEAGSTGRSSIFRIGVEACPQYCLFGSGLSTFPAVHEEVAIESPELGRHLTRFQSHNLWLGMAVEQGVVVMALWTASFAGALATARRARHPLGPAAFAGGVGLLATNLFLDGWEFKYFWLPLALGVLANNSTGDDQRDGRPTPVLDTLVSR